MKTKENELRKLSKLKDGLFPFTWSTFSVSSLNFILCANNSIPKREKIKMNRKIRMENVATSLRVFAIVSNKSSNLFQVLANLNTRKSLKALKTVIIEPVLELSSYSLLFVNTSDITISTRLAMTIKVSKILNHWPLKNILKPTANSLRITSKVKIAVKK
jgi:hypothetical protein